MNEASVSAAFTYLDKRDICRAKWALHKLRGKEMARLEKERQALDWTGNRHTPTAHPELDERIKLLAALYFLGMEEAMQAGKQMRLAKEYLEFTQRDPAAEMRALVAKQEAKGIPLCNEDGGDLKCFWCNSRWPDAKDAEGNWVHGDCV